MTVLKWLAVWLIVFIAIGTIGHQPWMNYYRLSRRGTVTPGSVTAAKPNLQVAYTFRVEGRIYQGLGRKQIEGHELAVGEDVLVHYLPGNPRVSCVGDPETLFESELPATAASDLLFSTLVVGMLAFAMRKRR